MDFGPYLGGGLIRYFSKFLKVNFFQTFSDSCNNLGKVYVLPLKVSSKERCLHLRSTVSSSILRVRRRREIFLSHKEVY